MRQNSRIWAMLHIDPRPLRFAYQERDSSCWEVHMQAEFANVEEKKKKRKAKILTTTVAMACNREAPFTS